MTPKQSGNEYLDLLKSFRCSIENIQNRLNGSNKSLEEILNYLELTKQELQSQIESFEDNVQSQNSHGKPSDSLNNEDVVPIHLHWKNRLSKALQNFNS